MVHLGLHSYWRVITIFPSIFSYCFCMLSDFAKGFEKKVWRVQVAHLHNAARALSSPSRCFQLSTNLGKDLSLILWLKKTNKSNGLAWYWWNSTDLGLIDMFLINLNAEIVACILSFRKSRHKPNLENTSKYGFFSPDFGEKMAAFWACACKLSWTLLSPARVQPLYGAGRKESSGTGLDHLRTPFRISHQTSFPLSQNSPARPPTHTFRIFQKDLSLTPSESPSKTFLSLPQNPPARPPSHSLIISKEDFSLTPSESARKTSLLLP